ncbi:MAG: hypothetical protein CVV46_16890 [Spirochaetae bacterium HGW-Spirochaetae-2]|jgi:hypothetical protein|nr:MAG: hypothetical protein CVV46_16890 [Spirochaetae bacterium HGW-Spirochaetae-2]PKO93850.1 MAG: hypothetical protein CVU15_00465 [Betaproteobacteria bacterium HGW-Betaproteobacteria-1]
MEFKKIDDQMHMALLELQNLVVADIAFYKQQQWRICNYALLLFAAIIAIPRLAEPKLANWEYVALMLISIFVLVVGMYLICEMSVPLKKGRMRLDELRKHFDRETVMKAYAGGGEVESELKKANEKETLEGMFNSIMILSFFVTIWLLIRSLISNGL